MIKIENVEITGWEAAIRGMRNPLNSWERSDSVFYDEGSGEYHDICGNCGPAGEHKKTFEIGPNDRRLMMQLASNGPVHAKYRRMIVVTMDITAPLYWWKEFDTYKVGTVANSCSTMHKIADKEFTDDDFSIEHLFDTRHVKEDGSMDIDCEMTIEEALGLNYIGGFHLTPYGVHSLNVAMLNKARQLYLKTKDKRYWWQMIQLLPTSYNQRRTVQLDYEVLYNIYNNGRLNHKLDEWRDFCHWIEELPCWELIVDCK